jgi:hypothetical protein
VRRLRRTKLDWRPRWGFTGLLLEPAANSFAGVGSSVKRPFVRDIDPAATMPLEDLAYFVQFDVEPPERLAVVAALAERGYEAVGLERRREYEVDKRRA